MTSPTPTLPELIAQTERDIARDGTNGEAANAVTLDEYINIVSRDWKTGFKEILSGNTETIAVDELDERFDRFVRTLIRKSKIESLNAAQACVAQALEDWRDSLFIRNDDDAGFAEIDDDDIAELREKLGIRRTNRPTAREAKA
jgi:hypothetical protein